MLESYGLDGTRTLYRAYHALGSDAWDAADLSTGAHAGTYASERKDGHGRTVATVERVHNGTTIEAREIQTTYLSTGEVTQIKRVNDGTGASVTRWMQYDSLGRMVLNVEPNTTKNFGGPGTDPTTMHAWRYAYDDAGDLVGTSDARGCGVNYLYDLAGRLLAEDFSPCLSTHQPYSAPDLTPGAEQGVEALYVYDGPNADAPSGGVLSDGTAFPLNGSLLLGRLTAVLDRGAETMTSYDGRGRVIAVARRVSKPGVPSDTVSARYASSWYVQTAQFDGADRPIAESTGAKIAQLQGPDHSSNIYTRYSKRGSVYQVDSSYGMLVNRLLHDADGLPQSIEYGDVAATRTDYGYDDRLRLKSVQTYRGPPGIWSASTYKPGYGTHAATTFQLLLEDLQYAYDEVDNPTEIHDFRDPTEWPIGSKPVSRKIAYDDLYRVNRVDYQYAAGTDTWVDPYQPETGLTATDTHLAKPSPHVSFDNRILYESFSYDWLGNSVSTDDDAKGFYDRSLGAVTNGTPNAGPYQLKSASNEGTGGTTRKGHLDAKYDDAGNLTDLAVVRSGPCLPSTLNCTQRFHYDWDEAGRLVRARRWDVGGTPSASDLIPTGTADADLTHAYDAGDMRVRKSASDASGNVSHTLYISAALEERRASWSDGANDYLHAKESEVPQLIAHGVRLGRVSWEPTGAPVWTVPGTGETRPSGQHVFLSLSDHLGSTSTVLDLDTSEVVEKRTSRAYGGVESDQRDGRWEGAKDEKSFTGKEEDEETGLIYFGARYLSIGLGRWVSADPKSVQSAGADLNAYAYVHGGLLRSIDPVGLDSAPSASSGTVEDLARCNCGSDGLPAVPSTSLLDITKSRPAPSASRGGEAGVPAATASPPSPRATAPAPRSSDGSYAPGEAEAAGRELDRMAASNPSGDANAKLASVNPAVHPIRPPDPDAEGFVFGVGDSFKEVAGGAHPGSREGYLAGRIAGGVGQVILGGAGVLTGLAALFGGAIGSGPSAGASLAVSAAGAGLIFGGLALAANGIKSLFSIGSGSGGKGGGAGASQSGGSGGPTSPSDGRATRLSPAESKVWRSLQNAGRGRRTSGTGRAQRYYEWDHTHGDIEVYDHRGRHLGSMEPTTGEMYKPAVSGRYIDL